MSAIDLSTLNASQRRIATTLDEPLFVEAGAGSGKTFTLTRRVAWALSPGSGEGGRPFLDGLDQVLVITFTHAAAREIKERVRSTLRAAGMRDASLAVDSAWISTIHGMCRRILQRSALDLGIDPAFEMCSNHESDTLLERAVDEVLGEARRSASQDPLARRAFEELEFGGVATRVHGLVKVAHACLRSFDDIVLPGGEGVADVMDGLLRVFEALGGAKLSKAAKDKVMPSLDALRAFAELAPGQRTTRRALEALEGCALPRSSKAIAELHAEAREALDLARATIALETVRELAPFLLDLARKTDARYMQLKHERSMLDNDDLVTLALEAISGNPVVAARYAGRFRLVMVDEFQDTDSKQLKLISLLAGSDGSEGAGGPRHLATVGDAQQSIYRFRGADVSVFNARGAGIDPRGHVRLDVNYRSHDDILKLVDAVCGGKNGVLEGFMHLDACPTRKDGFEARALPRVSIEVTSGPASSGYPSKQQVAVHATQIARRLARYRDEGERAGNMALLLGTTAKADLYIDALRSCGLECVVTGGSTFTRAPEVKVMLALLRTLANPHDTQSGLFPLLSSEVFELDANDFLLLGTRRQDKLDAPTKRTIDRGIESLEMFDGTTPSLRLRSAHEVLRRAFASLGTKRVADICLDVVRDAGWLSRLESAGPEGRAREANVLAAIRYIRDLTEEMGLGPSRAAAEFAHWLDVSKIPPATLAGEGEDTVRVMTIHASKGLEYPIVAVAECWNNQRTDGGLNFGSAMDGRTAVVITPKGGVTLDGVPFDEDPHNIASWAAMLRERNADADAQEKARLLYVALTRAREALVLGLNIALGKGAAPSSRLAQGVLDALFDGTLPPVGSSSVDYGGSCAAYVCHASITREKGYPYVLEANGLLDPIEGELAAEARDIVITRAEAARSVDLYPQEVVACDAVELAKAREDVFSYSSALAGLEQGSARGGLPTREERRAEDEGESSSSDEDKATSLGSAFHLLAQGMVETGSVVDPARVDAMCRRWHLSARQRVRLDAAIERWTTSDLRREALGYALVRAEVPFFSLSGGSPHGTYVEGAIDLLCTEGTACAGHALVVDYKTGDIGLDESQMRLRHEAQASLYADVLLRAGFDSVECAFVAVETGLVVRWRHPHVGALPKIRV